MTSQATKDSKLWSHFFPTRLKIQEQQTTPFQAGHIRWNLIQICLISYLLKLQPYHHKFFSFDFFGMKKCSPPKKVQWTVWTGGGRGEISWITNWHQLLLNGPHFVVYFLLGSPRSPSLEPKRYITLKLWLIVKQWFQKQQHFHFEQISKNSRYFLNWT